MGLHEFVLQGTELWRSFSSLDWQIQRLVVGGALGAIGLTVLAWQVMLPFWGLAAAVALYLRFSPPKDIYSLVMVKDLEHPGITMHRIAMGGCVVGAIFGLGTSMIFLSGEPAARWFLLAGLFGGAALAGLLYVWRNRHPVEYTDLYQPSKRK